MLSQPFFHSFYDGLTISPCIKMVSKSVWIIAKRSCWTCFWCIIWMLWSSTREYGHIDVAQVPGWSQTEGLLPVKVVTSRNHFIRPAGLFTESHVHHQPTKNCTTLSFFTETSISFTCPLLSSLTLAELALMCLLFQVYLQHKQILISNETWRVFLSKPMAAM